MQSEWWPLAAVVEHVSRAAVGGKGGHPQGALGILRILLCEGVILARRAGRNRIQPPLWDGAAILGDGTAELTDGFDAAGQPLRRHYEIELRRDDVLAIWPAIAEAAIGQGPDAPGAGLHADPEAGETEPASNTIEKQAEPDAPEIEETEASAVEDAASTPVTYKTGRAGQPSSQYIFMPEFYRRHAASERHGTISAWARVLAEWLKKEHPNSPLATNETIRRHLSSKLTSSEKADL